MDSKKMDAEKINSSPLIPSDDSNTAFVVSVKGMKDESSSKEVDFEDSPLSLPSPLSPRLSPPSPFDETVDPSRSESTDEAISLELQATLLLPEMLAQIVADVADFAPTVPPLPPLITLNPLQAPSASDVQGSSRNQVQIQIINQIQDPSVAEPLGGAPPIIQRETVATGDERSVRRDCNGGGNNGGDDDNAVDNSNSERRNVGDPAMRKMDEGAVHSSIPLQSGVLDPETVSPALAFPPLANPHSNTIHHVIRNPLSNCNHYGSNNGDYRRGDNSSYRECDSDRNSRGGGHDAGRILSYPPGTDIGSDSSIPPSSSAPPSSPPSQARGRFGSGPGSESGCESGCEPGLGCESESGRTSNEVTEGGPILASLSLPTHFSSLPSGVLSSATQSPVPKPKESEGDRSRREETLNPSETDKSKDKDRDLDQDKNKDGNKDKENDSCTICLNAPRQVGFLHGKTSHLCVCRTCARRLREGVHRCPICRQLIERVIDIY